MTTGRNLPTPEPAGYDVEQQGTGTRVDVVEIDGHPHIAITFGEGDEAHTFAIDAQAAAQLAVGIAKGVEVALKIESAGAHPANASPIILPH